MLRKSCLSLIFGIIKIKFICLACIFFFSGKIYSEQVFVDHSISQEICNNYDIESRSCTGTGILCCKSIQNALDNVKYGDTILVREGFYPECLIIEMKDSTPGYLTIMRYKDEKAVVDGNNPDIGPLVDIRCDRVKLSGLQISHSNTFGIISHNTEDIVIESCEVSYSNDGGIVFVDAKNIIVLGCHVHHNNYRGLSAAHEGISMHNVNTFEVSHCNVHDNKEEGIDAKYGSRFGAIHHNDVYRNNGPNIYIDKANLIEVHSNRVHDAVSKAGISLNIESRWHTEGLAWTLQYVNVYNNVIYNNSGGIGFWLEEGDGEEKQAKWDHIRIINNTIVGNARQGESRGGGIYILNPEPGNFGDSIIIRNNLFCNNTNEISTSIWDSQGKQQADKFIIDHNLFLSDEPSDYYGKDPIMTDDPGLVDPGASDFIILPGSAAVDSGSLYGAPSVDILGNSRPAGKAVDIGAYEYSR